MKPQEVVEKMSKNMTHDILAGFLSGMPPEQTQDKVKEKKGEYIAYLADNGCPESAQQVVYTMALLTAIDASFNIAAAIVEAQSLSDRKLVVDTSPCAN